MLNTEGRPRQKKRGERGEKKGDGMKDIVAS